MPSEKGPQRSSERWLLPWSPADFPWTRGPLVLSATALAEVEAQAVAGSSAGDLRRLVWAGKRCGALRRSEAADELGSAWAHASSGCGSATEARFCNPKRKARNLGSCGCGSGTACEGSLSFALGRLGRVQPARSRFLESRPHREGPAEAGARAAVAVGVLGHERALREGG